jgi:transposase
LLSVAVHPANIQDRDGVALVLDRRTRRLFPFIERIYGDGGYQGPKAAKAAAKTGCWTIEIVERSPAAVGFEVLPKRWIVERTFAWLSRFRGTRFRALRQDRCSLQAPRHESKLCGWALTPRSQHRFTEPATSAVQKRTSLSKK